MNHCTICKGSVTDRTGAEVRPGKWKHRAMLTCLRVMAADQRIEQFTDKMLDRLWWDLCADERERTSD